MLNYSDYNESSDVSLLKKYLKEDTLGKMPETPPQYPMLEQSPFLDAKHTNKPENITENKLNHIISLLEQTQDEKTETVLEELILYLFLGFLVIYIMDSFVKVGKYIR